jgi:threonine/homoserine/homoserine lactone efflux protein
MSIEQIWLYSLVIFSVSIVPGPSMILAFRDGAMYQIIGAFPSAFGNMVASLFQAVIALLVFHSIVSVTPQAQGIIQLIGACFICYIGYIFIKDGKKMRLHAEESGKSVFRSKNRRFMEGFLIAFFNPKAIIFFVALFPQFTNDVQIYSLLDLFQTFVPIGLIALLCFLIYSALGQFSRIVMDDAKIFGTIVPILGVMMILITLYMSASYFLT